jgi:hypothetical protein
MKTRRKEVPWRRGNRQLRLFAAAICLILLDGRTSLAQAFDFNSCCAFMFFPFRDEIAMNGPNDQPVHLIATESPDYPEQCRKLAKLVPLSTKGKSYYPIIIATRVCESIVVDKGMFAIRFYGNLPYNELEEGKRYRVTFFSRLEDLSISTTQGMSTPSNVFVEVVLNVNVQYEPGIDQKNGHTIVSISCRGQWRNFFTKPERLDEIFNNDAQAFSVAQNDECESSIRNTLKSQPSLVSSD